MSDATLLVLTALLVPLILCSNFLVVASVARFRRLHTPTNFLLASLSLSDIFIGLLIPGNSRLTESSEGVTVVVKRRGGCCNYHVY